MSFFGKLFGLTTECPACGTPAAKVSFFGIKCRSAGCIHHDPGYEREPLRSGAVHWSQLPPVTFDDPIQIEYTNHAGEPKTFTCDRRSLRIRGRHLSARVAPSGRRITLKLEGIGNLSQIEPAVVEAQSRPEPTGHEAYVMGYHSRHGTTSALNESLKAKYPEA